MQHIPVGFHYEVIICTHYIVASCKFADGPIINKISMLSPVTVTKELVILGFKTDI